MKRSLILLLMLALILPMLAVNALAADDMEYTITSLTMSDPDTYDEFASIPTGVFYISASITKNGSMACTAVLFAWYDADGRMLGCESVDKPYLSIWGISSYRTTIDNTAGEIYCIKAFVVSGDMTPLAAPKSIENRVFNGSIAGITVEDDVVTVSATADVDYTLAVQILNEEDEDVLWSGEADMMTEDTVAELPIDIGLPGYFIVTAVLYDLDGKQIGNTYTCLDYTRGFAEFQAKTEDDYDTDRIIDVAEEDDGNFAVLSADVIRLTQSPNSEGAGSYTFAADAALTALKVGDKISFQNSDGVYTTIRIATVTLNGGTVTVTADGTAGLADLYDVIKINAPIVAQTSEETGGAVYSFAPSAAEEPKDSGLFSDIQFGPAINSNIETSFGSLDAELKAGGQVVAYYDPAIWGDDYLRVEVLTKMSLEGDLFIGGVTGIKEEYQLFPEISLAGLEIIGHIPLELMGEFEIECQAGLNMHLSAEVGAGYTYNTKDGVHKHSYQEITPSKLSSTGEGECEVEVEVGLRFSVGVELLNELIDASIGVGAGMGVTGQIEAAITPSASTTEYHACDLCMGGRCYAFVNADVNMHYQISEKLEGDLIDVEIIRAEWTLGKVYLSLLNDAESIHKGETVFGWGECPNKKYLVTFVTYDNGTQETGHAVTVTDLNGRTVGSGPSTLRLHLYPLDYIAEATVETNQVRNSFTVTESMVVSLYARDFVLSGQVTDKETGEALSGVTVMVLQDGKVYTSAQTDDIGCYSFTLPGGAYTVSFVKDGYKSRVTSLSDQQSDKYLSVALEPIKDPGVLTGTVTDAATGSPITGAVIIASQDGKDPVYASTDASGVYTMELEEGSYRLNFSHTSYIAANSTAAVTSRETTTADMQLEKRKSALTVTVTDQDTGAIVEGAEVSVYHSGTLTAGSTTAADGTCTVELPDGSYTVRVFAPGYARTSTEVEMSGTDTALTVQVAPAKASGYCGKQFNDMVSDARWELSEDGILTVFGSGAIYDYGDSGGWESPWIKLGYSDDIQKVVIEEGVTGVGDYAFFCCSNITSVSLPQSLQAIGSGAFQYCSKLTSIDIPANVENISARAFEQTSLTRLYIDPDSKLTVIGKYAFQYCFLEEVYLPASLTEIKYLGIHPGRAHTIRNIYFSGTEAQWSEITIDMNLNDILVDEEDVIKSYPITFLFTDPMFQTNAVIHFNWND